MLELCASRQKPPSQRPQRVRVLAVPASSMPARSWRRLALRARRRWRGRSARPAPAASPISASRYALGARRCAPRGRSAHGAARLCAGPPRAAQPLAAIDTSRYALGANGVGAARPGACGALAGKSLPACPCAGCASMPARSWRRLALRARRRWRGRCAPGRLRQPSRGLALRARRRWRGRCAPGRLHVFPPITHALPLGGGHVVVEDAVRFALLETLGAQGASRSCRGRGWGGGSQTSSCTSVPGERLRATAACAVRVGAPRHCNRSALPPGQADPPHFERARAAARRLRGAS